MNKALNLFCGVVREAKNVTVMELFSHGRTHAEWGRSISSNINQKRKDILLHFPLAKTVRWMGKGSKK